jgi:hypothetical protein
MDRPLETDRGLDRDLDLDIDFILCFLARSNSNSVSNSLTRDRSGEISCEWTSRSALRVQDKKGDELGMMIESIRLFRLYHLL